MEVEEVRGRRSGFCRHTQFVKLPHGTMNRVFSQQIFRCDGIQANAVAFLIPAARHVLPLVIHSRHLRVSPPSILFSRFSALVALSPFRRKRPSRFHVVCVVCSRTEHHLKISEGRALVSCSYTRIDI